MSLLDSGFNTTLVVAHRRAVDLGPNNLASNRRVVEAVAQLLQGAANGDMDGMVAVVNGSGQPAAAGATVVISSGSGTLTTTINGVDIESDAAGTDTADTTAMAAAINASSNALVSGFVRAANTSLTLVLSSTAAGAQALLVTPSGQYVFTATAAATGKLGEFSISGNDTADALALANAINAYPVLNQSVRAESVAVDCFVYVMDGSSLRAVAIGTGLGGSGAASAKARCHIQCLIPGAIGNAITLAVSGTGASIANSNTRLVGGTGGTSGTRKYVNAGGAQ